MALLESHFQRLVGRRWGGFVEPLRAALEAEAKDDEARTQRLTVPYKQVSLVRGGEEDVWKLQGVAAEAVRGLDEGEWIELLDGQGRSSSGGRVIHLRPSDGSVEMGVRGAADPPRAGFLRPRSRRKILDQKRALLDELENPTGSLPHLVRLVAAPPSMPVPRSQRPARFVNSAVMRNRSQARAVAMALGLEDGQAMLIQGPPGTGKSTTAAEVNVQLIQRDPAVRILVCSHSNHGTDNMLMKVLPFLEDAEERIARIGFYDRVAREARPYYAPPDADLGDKNLIFTTIDALALQDIAGGQVYDYVILDEANRAGVLDSLLALARGRRMILVGDAMQLQPVMSEAEQQIVASMAGGKGGQRRGREALPAAMAPTPGPNNVIGKSLFAWILERRFAPNATILLDQQNRMHPSIGELVSRVFYGGKVRSGPAAPRRGTGMPAFPSPVMWVDTRSLRGSQESRAGGTSLFNVAEGRLVTSITRYLITHAPPGMTIGVIAAYAEQKELLRRMIGPRDEVPAERQLEVDTVDAFEGREKDIIVLSLVRSNRRRDVGFLRLEQRLNVAVSRARRLILVVGDTATLRVGYFQYLIQTAQSVGQIVPAPRLLGLLSGRPRQRVRERRERRPGRGEHVEAAPAEQGAETFAHDVVAEAPSVTPTAQAATDTGTPGELRRGRRRRAWERRREQRRLASLGEEAGEASESTAPPAEQTLSGGIFSPEDDAEPVYTYIPSRPASDVPHVDTGFSAVVGGEEERGAAEQPPAVPRRRRRLARPATVGAAKAAVEAPVRADAAAVEARVPEMAPTAEATQPARRGRRRTAAADTGAPVSQVEATPAAPAPPELIPGSMSLVEAGPALAGATGRDESAPGPPAPKKRATPRRRASAAEPPAEAPVSAAEAPQVESALDAPAAPKATVTRRRTKTSVEPLVGPEPGTSEPAATPASPRRPRAAPRKKVPSAESLPAPDES